MKKLLILFFIVFSFYSCSSEKEGNIDVTATWKVEEVESGSIQEDITWKYCVSGTCLENGEKVEEQWEEYVQYFKSDSDTEKKSYTRSPGSYSVYDKNGDYMRKIISMNPYSYVETKKYGDYYIKKEISELCDWTQIKQSIVDASWNEVDENITKLESEVKIWNYTWKLNQNFETKYKLASKNQISSFYKADTTFVDKKIVDNSKDVFGRMEEDVYDEWIFFATKEPKYDRKDYFLSDKGIAKNYLFKVDNDLYVLYEADFEQPEWVILLVGNEKEWLEWKETERMNIVNQKLTQKIVLNFGNNDSIKLTWKDGEELKIVKKDDLPIFSVKKFDDSGFYLLYLNSWYSISYIIDECK